MYLDLCEEAGFLSVILFLKKIIDILQLLIPIGLIIICAVDLGKMVVNPEEKSVVPKITKRMIAAVLKINFGFISIRKTQTYLM